MTIQKDSQALELSFDVVRQGFRSYLLDKKMDALLKGAIIPDDLISEIESFSERNAVVELENNEKICCPQCLKAYALSKARELGLPRNAMEEIGRMIKGIVGHIAGRDAYFLDQDNLRKL
ncbi:hypothetical protein J4217_00660 [Candidatus Pacearchaeota archaeon]|nr:hypothetical protein [Candidatus Pacearchaeota archaeon]